MARTSQSPEFLALQRKQLDERLRHAKGLASIESPAGGWVRAIRTALGMSAAQLGRRLGMSPQGALDLERREGDDAITIGKLRMAADALDCALRVVLGPRHSLQEAVRTQADAKARAERDRVLHTMRLEAQGDGVEQALDPARGRDAWLTTRRRELWD